MVRTHAPNAPISGAGADAGAGARASIGVYSAGPASNEHFDTFGALPEGSKTRARGTGPSDTTAVSAAAAFARNSRSAGAAQANLDEFTATYSTLLKSELLGVDAVVSDGRCVHPRTHACARADAFARAHSRTAGSAMRRRPSGRRSGICSATRCGTALARH